MTENVEKYKPRWTINQVKKRKKNQNQGLKKYKF